jgi:hypothetical protein
VRRLRRQEYYALHKLHLAGLASPRPYGLVELTPDGEYLLVTEFFDNATELGEAAIDDHVVDDGLTLIHKLRDTGLAHRDITPANLLVRDGHLLLIERERERERCGTDGSGPVSVVEHAADPRDPIFDSCPVVARQLTWSGEVGRNHGDRFCPGRASRAFAGGRNRFTRRLASGGRAGLYHSARRRSNQVATSGAFKEISEGGVNPITRTYAGAPPGTRTLNQWIKSPLLCQLS